MNKKQNNRVTLYADDINVEEEEFFGLIKRFDACFVASVRYRKDGGVDMDEDSALILKTSREDIKLPNVSRMDDIRFEITIMNEFSAAQNGAKGFCGWRGFERQAENDFRPWCTG